MAEEAKTCKGCTRNVIIKKHEVNQILTKNKIQASLMAPKEVYDSRIKTCRNCPSFVYGSTCSYSGCLIEYRAKFLHKKCPSPNGAKW